MSGIYHPPAVSPVSFYASVKHFPESCALTFACGQAFEFWLFQQLRKHINGLWLWEGKMQHPENGVHGCYCFNHCNICSSFNFQQTFAQFFVMAVVYFWSFDSAQDSLVVLLVHITTQKQKFMHLKKLATTACVLLTILFVKAQTSVALSPPMGWNSWNLFEEEVSEKLIKEIADAMVSSGMAAAGYQYIVLDDYWVGGRNSSNELFANLVRFPNGIKALADYVHAKGLKLGIYSDAADLTCGGVAGSYNFEELDAATFARWGIDYLKYDYCNAPGDMLTAFMRYKKMGDALRKTNRPIVYSICEWGQRQPWLWAKAAGGNLWRTTWDMRDTWLSAQYDNGHNGIMNTIDKQNGLEKYAGPGGWNDPDLLVTGLFGKGKSSSLNGRFTGCTLTEYRSQFTVWCMLAAPLMVNLDVRSIPDSVKAILLNKELIAINQDVLGNQASVIYNQNDWQIFKKELSGDRYAICILNRSAEKKEYSFNLNNPLKLYGQWTMYEIFANRKLNSTKKITGNLNAHDCVVYIFSAR
jgi:alpha-galactosidase